MYVCSTKGVLRYEFAGLIFGGAYTWRGLYMGGLIFEILQYFVKKIFENSELKQKFQL